MSQAASPSRWRPWWRWGLVLGSVIVAGGGLAYWLRVDGTEATPPIAPNRPAPARAESESQPASPPASAPAKPESQAAGPPPSAYQPPVSRERSSRSVDAPSSVRTVAAEVVTVARPADKASGAAVTIGVAYGTEKRSWLEWATREFEASPEARDIRVHLIPMGSVESARAIVDGDERIHVWSPASSLYRESFLRDWRARHRGNPILKEEPLAITPMVLVIWKERYDVIAAKSPQVSLRTVFHAMRAKTGWGQIAAKPEWGVFKFGHTHPDKSNSGLATLVLLAYGFVNKTTGLTMTDVISREFRDYLAGFQRGVTGLSNSTGTLMREMAAKGPSGFDALMVYESVAIDYWRTTDRRWGPLHVIYPAQNLWNENPYCILRTPWTTEKHHRAAETFLQFLLSEPVQLRALDHGFRPGNPAVPVKGPDSPFVKFAEFGLRADLPEVCQMPSAEVIDMLQEVWTQQAIPR